MERYFIIAGCVLVAAIFISFIIIFIGDVQERLGRGLSLIEYAALGICFPYSLLLLFLIPSKTNKEAD